MSYFLSPLVVKVAQAGPVEESAGNQLHFGTAASVQCQIEGRFRLADRQLGADERAHIGPPAANGLYQLRLQARQDTIIGYESLSLNSDLTLPNGYRDALEKCLAEEVKLSFRVAPVVAAQVQQKSAGAMRRLKRANFVSHQIQNRVATYTGTGRYNIYTGQ